MTRSVRRVHVGGLVLGDGSIPIQSMLSAPSYDMDANVRQARELESAGCALLRAAIPDKEAVALIPAIKSAVSIPLVADIHFDYRLALASVEAGIDKIRLNPGNIGGDEHVRAVAEACKNRGVPIRIGVNAGSLERDLLERYGSPTPEALVESALRHVRLLEAHDFEDIVISIKSSHVPTMIDAYRLLAERCAYPLHLGVTEAGTERMGTLKSAIGIGALLHNGIGDTIRVSLTADPVREVYAAQDILKCLGKFPGPQVISCPTCGRTRINVQTLAEQVEEALRGVTMDIRVAVMGCVVNGPGEAREADIGVAGGNGVGLLMKKGQILRKVPEDEIVPALLAEIAAMEGEGNA